MSKVPQRNKLYKKRAKPRKQRPTPSIRKPGKKKIVVFVIIAILAAIPFGFGKYIEFNSPGAFDSGAYVYSAKHILDGAEIGVEEKPSAQLGTLLVNILGVWLLGFNEAGPKLVQAILQATALLLTFIAMRKLFGTLSAALGVIVASVYLSSPLIAKFGNVKEQYMIAFMVMGISCFILYQLGHRWWYAVLAGAFLSWAPLFKQTGVSAIGAMGLFVILQPVLKNRTWKQTGVDILLLLSGAAVAIGPLYIWLLGWNVRLSLPYKFAWTTIVKMLPAKGATSTAGAPKAASGYLARSRELVPFAEQWPRVLRYYWLLILPIALAMGAIVARIARMVWGRVTARQDAVIKKVYERFVLLLALWWVLDMAFVWISPRSYEQYYLPLNASAAMLGGYLIAVYRDKIRDTVFKTKWVIVGLAGFLLMIIMSWHVFLGIERSPHSGANYGRKRKGYAQKLKEISRSRRDNLKGPWEIVGEYIRINSEPTDKIYVWGWWPGIYVQAQRLSSASRAVMMPRPAPKKLEESITTLLGQFEQEMPKFIVDSRKNHIPLDRPPYELWPQTKRGFLPLDKQIIAQYDTIYSKWLRDKFDEDEALRYEVMVAFREFVRQNYSIVQTFGQHVLFQLKEHQ